MKQSGKLNSRGIIFGGMFVVVLLAGALVTYVMPAISVKMPLGKKSWSASSFVSVIPMPSGGGEKADKKSGDMPKIEVDFKEILEKIAPPKKDGGGGVSVPLPVIVGSTVPVALVLAYAAVVAGLVLNFLPFLKKLVPLVTGVGVLLAGYTMGGTYYLGALARAKMEGGGGGIMGAIGKVMGQQITIQPEPALFGLLACLVLSYIMVTFFKVKTK